MGGGGVFKTQIAFEALLDPVRPHPRASSGKCLVLSAWLMMWACLLALWPSSEPSFNLPRLWPGQAGGWQDQVACVHHQAHRAAVQGWGGHHHHQCWWAGHLPLPGGRKCWCPTQCWGQWTQYLCSAISPQESCVCCAACWYSQGAPGKPCCLAQGRARVCCTCPPGWDKKLDFVST